jgi:hypothetical protein
MPVFSVPLIETDLLDLWRAAQAPGYKPSREAIAAAHENRLDPVLKDIMANGEAEAADLAEAQNPGYVAIRDGIKTEYRWTFRQ